MMFRVSNVEAFRRYQRDEEMDLDELLAMLSGDTPPSAQMAAGTAFHRALELASVGTEASYLSANGYTFNISGDMTLEVQPIRELRASKTWIVDGEPITISGQVDSIDGKLVCDHKTTGRFDPERYMAGCQWKFYLSIFGADWFRWNIFEIACNEDGSPPGMVWDVYASHRLEQFRYPGMEADCERLATDLARFARKHMPERIRTSLQAA